MPPSLRFEIHNTCGSASTLIPKMSKYLLIPAGSTPALWAGAFSVKVESTLDPIFGDAPCKRSFPRDCERTHSPLKLIVERANRGARRIRVQDIKLRRTHHVQYQISRRSR